MIHTRPHARVVTVTVPLDRLGLLTDREREVLRSVCELGMDDAAYRLCRSYETIKNQMTTIYRKLEITTGSANRACRACYLLGQDVGRRSRQ